MASPEKFKPTPYRGDCPKCGHGTMYPLIRFLESDVNEAPTSSAIVPNKGFARFFPFWSLVIILVTLFGGEAYKKAKIERGRAKIRHARAEILPRSPNSVVCPQCYEVLERI